MQTKRYNKARFNDKEEVILANEIIETCRYQLSPHAFALLMGLCQNISFQEEILPEFDININGLFKFFNLSENNGKRYEVVRDAFENIASNPLSKKISKNKWAFIPWLSAEFNGDNNEFVQVSFHTKVIPYLLAFRRTIMPIGVSPRPGYTKITPYFYNNFTSKYATWLYPFFKKWQNTATYRTETVKKDIKWIREKTFTEKTHKQTCDLLSQVVNKAINEINKHSELDLKPISRKNGNIKAEGETRAMTHLYFEISTKPKYKKVRELPRKKDPKTEEELREYYNSVEVLSYEMVNGIRGTFGSLEMYAKEKSCIIKRIGDKYFKCK